MLIVTASSSSFGNGEQTSTRLVRFWQLHRSVFGPIRRCPLTQLSLQDAYIRNLYGGCTFFRRALNRFRAIGIMNCNQPECVHTYILINS